MQNILATCFSQWKESSSSVLGTASSPCLSQDCENWITWYHYVYPSGFIVQLNHNFKKFKKIIFLFLLSLKDRDTQTDRDIDRDLPLTYSLNSCNIQDWGCLKLRAHNQFVIPTLLAGTQVLEIIICYLPGSVLGGSWVGSEKVELNQVLWYGMQASKAVS